MNNLNHIESSGTRRGEYIAYLNGAQRVRRCHGGWETYALGSAAGEFTKVSARTLTELDEKIARLRERSYPPIGNAN